MKHIEIDGEEDGASGLMALIVTVLELLLEAMEREAIRRMESGQLSPDEIERLGAQLQTIAAEIESIKEQHDIEDDVETLRDDLNSLVSDAIEQVREEETQYE